MSQSRLISLRAILTGEVVDFLRTENMSCTETQDGLVELINALSYYREEGKALFPEMYIIDDFEIIKSLPQVEYINIGSGNRNKETMLHALKKCAPITEGNWAIYLLRSGTSFEYGIFRCGVALVSVPISKVLIDSNTSQQVILVHQVADKIVELRGCTASPILINFGINSVSNESPIVIQGNFIDCIIEKALVDFKEQTNIFFGNLFLEVLQKGHGTLAIVLDQNKGFPEIFDDCIRLKV